MRTLVKIGLVFPMLALVAFTFAVADTAPGDTTELGQELNRDLGVRVAPGVQAQSAEGQEGTGTTEATVLGISQDRRGIASRRAGNSGRGMLSSTNRADESWWRGSGSGGNSGGGNSDDHSGGGNSGSGDSGKDASPTDPSSDSSS